jgi:rSAM/selenodomain-associated transferase 2
VSDRAEVSAARLRISVIIPAWHEAENLAVLLPALSRLDGVTEIIVVNASGDSASERIILSCGAALIAAPAPNRGEQMNLGAQAASGDVIVFQHCDTDLDTAHLAAIEAAMSDPQIIGGAFYRKFDDHHPRLRWLESMARFLTRHGGTLYGDQTIFVRRETFVTLGGFAKIPLMEDIEFSRRLRAAGRIAVLDPPVRSSARRHLRKGAWRTSIQNGLFIVLYHLGVSPHRLHRWYYRSAEKTPGREAIMSS